MRQSKRILSRCKEAQCLVSLIECQPPKPAAPAHRPPPPSQAELDRRARIAAQTRGTTQPGDRQGIVDKTPQMDPRPHLGRLGALASSSATIDDRDAARAFPCHLQNGGSEFSPEQLQQLEAQVLNELIGFGPIEPLLDDPP